MLFFLVRGSQGVSVVHFKVGGGFKDQLGEPRHTLRYVIVLVIRCSIVCDDLSSFFIAPHRIAELLRTVRMGL